MAVFDKKPLFRYLDLRPNGPLGGRGGAVRLYLLANNIPYDEELVSFQDWGATEKAKCTKEDNPAGVLPVLVVGDKKYAEHVAICRYLARKNGEYGKDIEVDAVADMAADAQADWRSAWGKGTFGGEDAAKEYSEARCKHYTTLEWYYAQKPSPSSPYLSGGEVPGFADCLVVNMMWDDLLKHGAMDLSDYPTVKAMHDAASSNPELSAWKAQWEAQSKAMAA